jgi:rubrerythrin
MSTRLDLSKLTLMDALDLAALIELEAHKRYTEFAEGLGSRGVDDAGAVFRSMAVNENKHCEEAPDFGEPRWNMSALKAYQVALFSEQKAQAFYDEALSYVKQPDVKALFEELRDEETEHVRMLVNIIAKLPPSAEIELEDEDYDPDNPVRNSAEV